MQRVGTKQGCHSANQAVPAELLLLPHGHQQENGTTGLAALVGPGLAAKASYPRAPMVPGLDKTQMNISNKQTNS